MALLVTPLISTGWLVIRITFFAWLINFVRCFATIPDDIDAGRITSKLLDVLILLSAFTAACIIAWMVGKSLLFSICRRVTAFFTLVIHDINQRAKVRTAKESSVVTFEDELAEAAEDQVASELARVEAANWDFEAVIRLADEAEARERQRRTWGRRSRIVHRPSPIAEE